MTVNGPNTGVEFESSIIAGVEILKELSVVSVPLITMPPVPFVTSLPFTPGGGHVTMTSGIDRLRMFAEAEIIKLIKY